MGIRPILDEGGDKLFHDLNFLSAFLAPRIR